MEFFSKFLKPLSIKFEHSGYQGVRSCSTENTQDQIPMTFMDRVGNKSYRQWGFLPIPTFKPCILHTKLQLCDIRSYILGVVLKLR